MWGRPIPAVKHSAVLRQDSILDEFAIVRWPGLLAYLIHFGVKHWVHLGKTLGDVQKKVV